MLSQERRLRTKDITRLFARSSTQKIAVYPFVYFIWFQLAKRKVFLDWKIESEQKLSSTYIQRGIQLPNKLLKTSVERHFIKRMFYDCIDLASFSEWIRCILAVPQKKWGEELKQLLATTNKRRIIDEQKKMFLKSLSLLSKKLWELNNELKK